MPRVFIEHTRCCGFRGYWLERRAFSKERQQELEREREEAGLAPEPAVAT